MTEPQPCPATCPNRAKKMGAGYSYGLAIILTLFLAAQSIRFKADNNGWEVNLEPIPMSLYLPGIGVIASILGFNTDKLASVIGAFLTKDGKD